MQEVIQSEDKIVTRHLTYRRNSNSSSFENDSDQEGVAIENGCIVFPTGNMIISGEEQVAQGNLQYV